MATATEILATAYADIRAVISKAEADIANIEYQSMIAIIRKVSKQIYNTMDKSKTAEDGRTESIIRERPFLNKLKEALLLLHPEWSVVITQARDYCDVEINSIPINLKMTNCKSADNAVSKKAIFYSITGDSGYKKNSNWNAFDSALRKCIHDGTFKTSRDRTTELHYLVINKITGDVILKSIFDVHTYKKNAINNLQIDWRNEFLHRDYTTNDADYIDKVFGGLIQCCQASVRDHLQTTEQFATTDLHQLKHDVLLKMA